MVKFWTFIVFLLLYTFSAVDHVSTQECLVGEYIAGHGVNLNIRPEEVIKCPEGGECFQSLCKLNTYPDQWRVRSGCDINGPISADDTEDSKVCSDRTKGSCAPQPKAAAPSTDQCHEGGGPGNSQFRLSNCRDSKGYCATIPCQKGDGTKYLLKGCINSTNLDTCVKSAKQCRDSGGTPEPCELCAGAGCNDRELLVETTSTTENNTTEATTMTTTERTTASSMAPAVSGATCIISSSTIGLLMMFLLVELTVG